MQAGINASSRSTSAAEMRAPLSRPRSIRESRVPQCGVNWYVKACGRSRDEVMRATWPEPAGGSSVRANIVAFPLELAMLADPARAAEVDTGLTQGNEADVATRMGREGEGPTS